ncbi:MAG: hypothetical protein EBZ49_18645, partial [Proteobacteria bacterium]|nr:hypothetical protein [Pseudomonadota bacterium]
MGEPLLKITESNSSESSEFSFSSLLTKVLVESLCPLIKSQVVFGKMEKLSSEQVVDFWVDAVVRGDLEGRVGLSAEGAT